MTDPWMVQNSYQQNNTVENGTKENGIEHQRQVDQQQQQSEEENSTQGAHLEFEDNFTPIPAINNTRNNTDNSSSQTTQQQNENNSNTNSAYLEPLPDSDSYLRGLERKLQKIKKGASLVEALAEKRNDCLRQLLNSGDPDNNNAVLALDQPLNNPEFYRHLQPIQALSVGELVHIVKYDQLQQEEQEQDNVEKHQQQEIESESNTEEGKKNHE